MVQETYGHYAGAFLAGTDERHDDAFIELWRSQKTRRLPFRFGCVDKDEQAHVRPRTATSTSTTAVKVKAQVDVHRAMRLR